MAGEDFRSDAEQDALRREDLFQALADAYAFVHGWENKRTMAALTVGDLLQARIDEIRGPHPQGLPSRLDEVDTVKAAFDSAVAQLRQEAADEGLEE